MCIGISNVESYITVREPRLDRTVTTATHTKPMRNRAYAMLHRVNEDTVGP